MATINTNFVGSAQPYCGTKAHCPSGNCPGCKDGKPWCEDPKCTPLCRGCGPTESHGTMMLSFFGLILLLLFMITSCLGISLLYFDWVNHKHILKNTNIQLGPEKAQQVMVNLSKIDQKSSTSVLEQL